MDYDSWKTGWNLPKEESLCKECDRIHPTFISLISPTNECFCSSECYDMWHQNKEAFELMDEFKGKDAYLVGAL